MTEEFVWTDELVQEYINTKLYDTNLGMEDFKKYKTPKTEKIVVRGFGELRDGNETNSVWYQFWASRRIQHEKKSSIVDAIENILNPVPHHIENFAMSFPLEHLIEMKEDAFNAGRGMYKIVSNAPFQYNILYRFPTFQDYLKSKQ